MYEWMQFWWYYNKFTQNFLFDGIQKIFLFENSGMGSVWIGYAGQGGGAALGCGASAAAAVAAALAGDALAAAPTVTAAPAMAAAMATAASRAAATALASSSAAHRRGWGQQMSALYMRAISKHLVCSD